MRHVFIFVAIFAFAAAAADFKFGELTLTVPDGFVVERIAAPPLVNRPVSISLDDAGRLYVTDSAGMAGSLNDQLKTRPHNLLRLEDLDGDGAYEKSALFADKLMFPEGCLWLEGSVYSSGPPQIWKFTDADNDGVAEKRDLWLDAKTLTGCANDLHGPYAGRDGWIYWCKGAFAKQTYDRPGQAPFTTRASHIFRALPDGSGLETVLTGGMDNPVGVAVNSVGERFLACTFFQNPAGGKRDGLIHAIYGGVYGKTHDVIDDHKRTGDVLPVLAHFGAAAPCGLACYDSTGLGADFRGNLFTCCFNTHKVIRSILTPDGASYKAIDTDFLISTHTDFHPTDVLEDADGSLIVVDTGGWYKVCCPTSQLAKPDVLGAIYRIRKTDAPKFDDPRGLKINWPAQNSASLAALLGDSRLFVARRALREIVKLPGAVRQLTEILSREKKADVRLSAVWALTQIKEDGAREALRQALNDADSSVVHAAIHAASLWRDTGAIEKLLTITASENWAHIRAAAEALGRIGDTRAVPVLLKAAARWGNADPAGSDAARRILEHSLLFALIELGDAQAVRAGLTSANPHERRAALIALDQIGDGLKAEQVTPYLADKDPVLIDTTRWIIARHSNWGDAVAEHFAAVLPRVKLRDENFGDLGVTLARMAKSPAIQALLAKTAAGEDDAASLALQAMPAAGLKELPEAWAESIRKALTSPRADLRERALAAARAFRNAKSAKDALSPTLLDIARDPRASGETRLNALAAAAPTGPLDAATFDLSLASFAPEKDLAVRISAARVLASYELNLEQKTAVLNVLAAAGPMELYEVLPAFERNPNEALGLKLVETLKSARGARNLRADRLRTIFAKYPESVQSAAKELYARINADAAQQAEHLTAYAAKLPAGDVRRGQIVFLSAKAACSTCHAIGYAGGQLGPDLTNIAKGRTDRDLLESILYPSASFVRSYEPFMVVTKNGERINGILKKDAPDEVLLATGAQTEVRIARGDIKQMQPGVLSLMPEGFETVLTPQEIADLVAFLKAAK